MQALWARVCARSLIPTACDQLHTLKMLSLRKENRQRRIEKKKRSREKKNPNFICIQSRINNFQNLKTINLVIDEYTLIVVHRFFLLSLLTMISFLYTDLLLSFLCLLPRVSFLHQFLINLQPMLPIQFLCSFLID